MAGMVRGRADSRSHHLSLQLKLLQQNHLLSRALIDLGMLHTKCSTILLFAYKHQQSNSENLQSKSKQTRDTTKEEKAKQPETKTFELLLHFIYK